VRILEVCPFFTPHVGGVESHVALISAELARRGHDVTVLTSRHERHLPAEEQDPRGFRIVRIPSLGTIFATPLTFRVGKYLKEREADVVHLHYPPPLTSYFAARALRGSRARIFLTYHCDLYLEGPVGGLLSAIYQKVFLPPTLAVARHVIVHTEEYARTSRYLTGVDLKVIPSLVDTERFQPLPEDLPLRKTLGLEGKRVLLFVGRLVPHKGVDDLLHAVATLPENVVLVVVGGGPALSSLQSEVRELGLDGRVIFAQGVTDADLPRYYSIASVVALPSQNRLEGFGLSAVNALSCGRPVIVADMPGVRDVVENGVDGLLTEPLLPEVLARKVLALMNDPPRLEEMGKRARENALRKYSAGVVVDQLEALYRSTT
jgi:rhamnosyl/mannosyltransferase